MARASRASSPSTGSGRKGVVPRPAAPLVPLVPCWVGLPPGLPVVWRPSIVWNHVDALSRWLVVADVGSGKGRLKSPGRPSPARDAVLDALGLYKSTRGVPVPVRRCPTCMKEASLLILYHGMWTCRSWRSRGRGCNRERFTVLEMVLAEIAHARVLGYYGPIIRSRQLQVAKWMQTHIPKSRTIDDLWIIALAGELLRYTSRGGRALHRGLPSPTKRDGLRSPWWWRMAPLFLEATVDAWLHPMAYRARFGGLSSPPRAPMHGTLSRGKRRPKGGMGNGDTTGARRVP